MEERKSPHQPPHEEQLLKYRISRTGAVTLKSATAENRKRTRAPTACSVHPYSVKQRKTKSASITPTRGGLSAAAHTQEQPKLLNRLTTGHKPRQGHPRPFNTRRTKSTRDRGQQQPAASGPKAQPEGTKLPRAVEAETITVPVLGPSRPRFDPKRDNPLSRIKKARLRLWLLRCPNGAGRLRTIVEEVNPTLARRHDLYDRLKNDSLLLAVLPLQASALQWSSFRLQDHQEQPGFSPAERDKARKRATIERSRVEKALTAEHNQGSSQRSQPRATGATAWTGPRALTLWTGLYLAWRWQAESSRRSRAPRRSSTNINQGILRHKLVRNGKRWQPHRTPGGDSVKHGRGLCSRGLVLICYVLVHLLVGGQWALNTSELLSRTWWNSGIDALGRTRSSCEEGDHVETRTRHHRDVQDENSLISRAIQVRGLAPVRNKAVCVKQSLCTNAGNGLFARRDICTYDNNIRSAAQQRQFRICPYLGEAAVELGSDYIMTVGSVTVDARRPNSCWARFANDALDAEMDNVKATLIEGTIWLVPLPGVEILAGQELYLAYDWEYWYRKWRACPAGLKLRIANRYPIHASALPGSGTAAQEENARISEFWYNHWAWWTTDMRQQIRRYFKPQMTNRGEDPYQLDASSADDTASESDDDTTSATTDEGEQVHDLRGTAEHRRHPPTVPPPQPGPRLEAPRMQGPMTAPTSNRLPVAAIDQADRPFSLYVPRPIADPNPRRPSGAKPRVWSAAPRSRHKIPTNMYTEISGSHWRKYCEVMDSWHDNDDDKVASLAVSSDLRLGFLNVNRLEDHNIDYLLWFYESKRLDVLFLLDTRLTAQGGQFANAKIKERLGNDILVLQSKTRPDSGPGGQMAIVRPHLRKHLASQETDPASLGVLFALGFRHGQRIITLASVYWPCENNGPNSLRSKLTEYMNETGVRGSASEYCKHLVENVLDRTMEDPLNTFVVGGDWNANWQDSQACPRRGHTGIARWAQEIGLANAHRALLAGNHPTRYPSVADQDRSATTIDHVLTTYAAALVTEAGLSLAPIWHAITDHRPLWIAVRLDVPLTRPPERQAATSTIRRVELDRKDLYTCEEYRGHLRLLLLDQMPGGRRGEDLGEWIENICASSVNIVRAHMKPLPKASRRRKDGWSPTYTVQNKMLMTLIRIRQQLTGQAGKRRWPEWFVCAGVKREIGALYAYAARQFPEQAERDKILQVTGRPPSHWLTTTPTEADMTDEAKEVLKAIHGRKRTEHRKKMRSVRRNREEARQAGKYARWLKSLVGKDRISFDMDKLTLSDGSIVCDPLEVHEMLTQWFDKWFAADRPQQGTMHDDKWIEFLNDREGFDRLLVATSLESWVKDALWASMQMTSSKLTAEQRAELTNKLQAPPSFEEFVQRLIRPRGGPTAGLTGLTYNMMAEWPEEVMRAVYESLCRMQAEGTTPLHWKNKALLPMPKVANPTLEQLRPLMLIEVLRKVWTGFSVKAVWEFLEKHHVLEDIQFAYRRNREAGVAQLCLRNAIEEAQETESAILLGSYDKYHAFDSISRAAMKLSFRIAGLSEADAVRLVDMEKDSRVTVCTPTARHHWAEKYSRTLHRAQSDTAEPSFFIPVRGTPQGDTISCLTWTVFENICLAALRTDPGRVKLYIRGANGLIYEAADLCYADDLNTVSPSLAGMQRKADIIGGIAEALHLRIAIKKLRQIAVDFGSQQLLPTDRVIHINDGTGKVEPIRIPAKGAFDQLGYKHSVGVFPRNQRPDLDQFKRTRATLIAVCRAVQRKSATAQCKIDAVEMSIYNTALWRAQCSPWSLEMCRELDKPINRLLRNITKNLPGFPSKLLHGKAPGLNIPCLSDQIQIRKMAQVQRGITNAPAIAAGPEGLLQRGARLYGLTTIPGVRMSFGPSSKHHWSASLSHRLDECALLLTTGGRDAVGTHEEQLNSHTNQAGVIRQKQVRKLVSLSVHTYGDLLEQTEESSKWTDTGLLGLNFLDQLLEQRAPAHRPTVLRAGSCWTARDGTILEVIGRLAQTTGPDLMCRRWICPEGDRSGATVLLSEDTPALGAGTQLLLNYQDIWPCTTATRAILERDASYPRGDKDVTRRLIREWTQLAPSIALHPPLDRTPAERIAEWLSEHGLDEGQFEIFTDGSWKDHTPWLQHCFHGSTPEKTISSASVVCLHTGPDRWTRPGLIMQIAPSPGLELGSGYPAELSALLCASQVALITKPAAIITDCESAINLIRRGFIPRAEQKKDHATLARLLVRYSRILKPQLYRHTYAHLDEYLPPEMHTEDQRGNILADKAASTSDDAAEWVSANYPHLQRLSTTMKSVHQALLDDIPLCVTNGDTPTLPSLHNIFNAQNFRQYISDRLVKTTHGALYRDASYNFCAQVFDLDQKRDLPQRASCDRLIFDKVWQPWNVNKYKKLAAPVCPHCEVEDSLSHLLRDCTEPATRRLRVAAVETARSAIAGNGDLAHAVLDAILDTIKEPYGAALYRALWLPQHIESFRSKLYLAQQISLDPMGLPNDAPRKREIQAALLDISKILGQAALNIMRERNLQTQDALNPLRTQQSGKSLPPPLALYNNQKKFKKKKVIKTTTATMEVTNSRVKSMFPAFVAAPRKHPRVLAQEHQRQVATANETAAQAVRAVRAEQEAAFYANAPAIEPEVIPPWDPRVFPYHNPYGLDLEGPNQPHNDQSAEDRSERIIRAIVNQVQRAEIYEDTLASADRREADEHHRIDREIYLRDPANAPLSLRLTGPPGTKFSKAAIAARERDRAACCRQSAPPETSEHPQDGFNPMLMDHG